VQYQMLLKGYDISGDYCDENTSSKQALFAVGDTTKKFTSGTQIYLYPTGVNVSDASNSAKYSYIYGKTQWEYLKALKISANLGYKGVAFSGEIKSSFGFSSSSSGNETCATYNYRKSLYSVTLDVPGDNYRSRLNATAKDAIDNGNTDDLIKIYGTHFAKGIICGGIGSLHEHTSESLEQSKEEISVEMTSKYEEISLDTKITDTEEQKKMAWMANTEIVTKGGSNKSVSNNKGFMEWAESVTVEHSAVIDWYGGLLSLDVLANNDERKKQIKVAINKYLVKQRYGYLIAGSCMRWGQFGQNNDNMAVVDSWGVEPSAFSGEQIDLGGALTFTHPTVIGIDCFNETYLYLTKPTSENANNSYFVVGIINKYDNQLNYHWGLGNMDTNVNDPTLGTIENHRILQCQNDGSHANREVFLNVIKATDENWNKHNSFYLVVGGYLKLKTSAKEKNVKQWGLNSNSGIDGIFAQKVSEGMCCRDDELNWCAGEIWFYLVPGYTDLL